MTRQQLIIVGAVGIFVLVVLAIYIMIGMYVATSVPELEEADNYDASEAQLDSLQAFEQAGTMSEEERQVAVEALDTVAPMSEDDQASALESFNRAD